LRISTKPPNDLATVLKKVGWVLGSLLALALAFVMAGYLLPSRVTFETTAEIDATPHALFGYFNSQAGMQRWWTTISEEFARSGNPGFGVKPMPGPSAGVGTRMDFTGDDGEVAEHWQILASTSSTTVVYDVDFLMFKVERTISLEAADADTTMVRWSETGEFSNPLLRWTSVLMRSSIVGNFDHSLAAVKKLSESPR
jgi:hypothetical protein